MRIIYWNTNTTTQIGGAVQQFFAFTVPPITPVVGVYMVLNGWEPLVDMRVAPLPIGGGFQWRNQTTTTPAVVVLMMLDRRTFRGVYRGAFAGVN